MVIKSTQWARDRPRRPLSYYYFNSNKLIRPRPQITSITVRDCSSQTITESVRFLHSIIVSRTIRMLLSKVPQGV